MADKQNSNAQVFGFADGVRLAIQMLDDLESDQKKANQCCLNPEYRSAGSQQRNIVLEYLTEARAGNPGAEAGFAAVLTDFVAACRSGFVPDTSNYAPWSAEVSHAGQR